VARLPILMYHNVTSNTAESKGLTIAIEQLEKQLHYLSQNGFMSYFVSELLTKTTLPQKSIILTFDDVTQNQLLYAMPLLEKYRMKATFFVPFAYVGKSDLWNHSSEKIMTVAQLKQLNPAVIELGHHSFAHDHYSNLSPEQVQEDFDQSFSFIAQNNIAVAPVLAYPYGNFPREKNQKEVFFSILQKNNIQLGLRIGNRVNRFPFKSKYELQRIDIKGEDSMFVFKWKLRLGKLRLF